MVNIFDIFANEGRHGALVAAAEYFINPWAMVALSTCFQAIILILSTNILNTNTEQTNKISNLTNLITGLQDENLVLK